MSSLIRVLLFDWMVTWRGPEGVGLVELVFFTVTRLPSGDKSCEMSRAHVAVQGILLGGMGLFHLCSERLQREKWNFQVNTNSWFRQAENLQGKAVLSLQLQYLCDVLNGFQHSSGGRYPQKGSGKSFPVTEQKLGMQFVSQVWEGLGNSSACLIVMFGLEQFTILSLIMGFK